MPKSIEPSTKKTAPLKNPVLVSKADTRTLFPVTNFFEPTSAQRRALHAEDRSFEQKISRACLS